MPPDIVSRFNIYLFTEHLFIISLFIFICFIFVEIYVNRLPIHMKWTLIFSESWSYFWMFFFFFFWASKWTQFHVQNIFS